MQVCTVIGPIAIPGIAAVGLFDWALAKRLEAATAEIAVREEIIRRRLHILKAPISRVMMFSQAFGYGLGTSFLLVTTLTVLGFLLSFGLPKVLRDRGEGAYDGECHPVS